MAGDPRNHITVDGAGKTRKPCVLLIDDSDLALRTWASFLTPEFECVFASDGTNALGLLSTVDPDAIVSDVEMPTMGGLALARALKASDRYRHIPVLLVTSRDNNAAECLDAGADDFLNKPVRAREFQARVRAAVRSQLQARQLRQAFEDIDALRADLDATLDGAADAIVSYASDGRALTWNPAAAQLFPMLADADAASSESHFVQSLIVEDSVWFDQEGPAFGAGEERVVRRGTQSLTVELRCRRASDQRLVAVIRDVSWNKATELQLQETNNQLFEASRQAGQAEVATGVLHNVGNVLSSLNVSSELIEETTTRGLVERFERFSSLLSEKRPQFGGSLGREGDLLVDYCAELLEQFRVAESNLKSELRTFRQHLKHASAVVANQQRFAKPVVAYRKVVIIDLLATARELVGVAGVEIETTVESAYIDEHRVLEILVNLIQNAGDASSNHRSPKIRLTCQRISNERLSFMVRDNGEGMSAAQLERVFERGFTTKASGHGFGLHYCANTARSMGGNLSVSSDGPNAGATFELTLPEQSISDARLSRRPTGMA